MSQPEPKSIQIDTPCPMAWSQLQGDEKKRHCAQCQLHVHNAEELTRREAEALVQESEDRVCMRIVLDGEGQPLFKPEELEPAAAQASKMRLAGLALAAGGVLAACQPQSDFPMELVGDVCPPPAAIESTETGSTPAPSCSHRSSAHSSLRGTTATELGRTRWA